MKNFKMNKLFPVLIVLVFLTFACKDKTSKKDNNNSTEVSVEKDQTTSNNKLIKILKDIEDSDIGGYLTISLKESDESGYEIKDEGDDYIVIEYWDNYNETELKFQLLSVLETHEVWALNTNTSFYVEGGGESSFHTFRRFLNNGKWELFDIYINNELYIDAKDIFDYNTKEKSLVIHSVNGNMTAGDTLKYYKWNNSYMELISSNETVDENEFPNPIVVDYNPDDNYFGDWSIEAPFSIAKDYYNDVDKNKIDIVVFSKLAEDIVLNKTNNEIKNDFESEPGRYFIKYKYAKCYFGEAMGDPNVRIARVIDDYEIIGKSPIIATFESFSYGDFSEYGFVSPLGYMYYFNQMPDNVNYDFGYIDDQYQYGTANPKLKSKKFKIHFHSEIITNEYDGGSDYEYFYVDKIEMIN